VDFHQHFWPEPFVEALRRRTEPPCLRLSELELTYWKGEVDLTAHDPARRLALLEHDGIDSAVVSLSPALGVADLPPDERSDLVSVYEDSILEVSASSGGAIVPLGVLEGDRLDRFRGASVGADRLLELDRIGERLDELERGQKLLFVHPGPSRLLASRPSWWAEVVDFTAQMQAAYALWLAEGVDRWPRLRVVFAILAGGSPIQLERLHSRGIGIREMLHPNLFFDTSSYGRRALELCMTTFGVDCLLYGSDVPVIDSRTTLDAVRSFGDAVEDTLCRRNPARLLS
jgi:hypothetical protein